MKMRQARRTKSSQKQTGEGEADNNKEGARCRVQNKANFWPTAQTQKTLRRSHGV